MEKKSLLQASLVGVVVLVVLFLIRYFNIALPISVTTSNISSELSVVGEGKVDVNPDTSYVDLGVQIESAPSAEVAQTRLSETNNKVVAALKSLGLTDENLKTSNYSVFPNYVYEEGRSRINGYNGNVTITVKTDKVDMAGKIIETATKSGANQVLGTRFSVDKPEKYREEARDKAIANAREQAEKLANSLGIRLGRVTNIVESSAGSVPPIFYATDKAMSAGRGGAEIEQANFQPGTQTISTTVTLFFEKR